MMGLEMGSGAGRVGQAEGGGVPHGLPPGIETPEQMLAFLEEIQRQGGNIDEIVPPDLAVSKEPRKSRSFPQDLDRLIDGCMSLNQEGPPGIPSDVSLCH